MEVSNNVICREITTKQVKECPRKWKLPSGCLSVKYVVLHRIGAAKWVPTNHTSNISTGLGKIIYIVGTKTNFDFGPYVFEQTMKLASFSIKMLIAFPSLICGIIMSQHPSILLSLMVPAKEIPLYYYIIGFSLGNMFQILSWHLARNLPGLLLNQENLLN